ncbi:MAG: hypothetical protein ACFFCV_20485 [Promethearchaeota archaeon]
MHCENCGAELFDPNLTYCPSCGTLLKVKTIGGKLKKPLYKNLDSDYILLLVDEARFKVWMWCGSNTTIRMRFLASKSAEVVRDRYGQEFEIVAVDEGSEPLEFKQMIGLSK